MRAPSLFGLFNGPAHGSAVYARPDLAIAIVVCLVELATVAVLFRVQIKPSRSGTSRISPG